LSNPITSRSQTLFIDENLLRPLPDGRYFVVLRVNSIGNNQFFDVSETVTFDFLDDQLNTFDGPYEITVNLDSNTTKIATVFTLEIIDRSRYVITPENTII